MALTAMNPKQSRQLAVGLLVAAILAVGAAIAIPVWLVDRHYSAALDEATNKLARYQRIATMRPELVRQLDAMRAKESRKFFLRIGAAALSAAEAQEALRAVIEANGGRLITMQAPTVRDEGRYRQITLNTQLTANVLALRKILNALETNTPYLFIDNLTIKSQVPGNFRPGPGAEPEMFVIFDVSGYAQTGS